MGTTWMNDEIKASVIKAAATKDITVLERDLLEIEQEMLETINEVDEYCFNKGTMGGLDWGFNCLNRAFDSLQPGLIIMAGLANAGKSAMCMQLGWQIAKANQVITPEKPHKSYVMYFSLDDNNREILPRIVAIDQMIPINAVKSPKKYEDNINFMARRKVGMEVLKSNIGSFKIMDSTRGTSIEYIEDEIRRHYVQLAERDENTKLVIFIDNFHDITVDAMQFKDNANAKYDYIADSLSKICTNLDIPIICTAEFRKLNGSRRPTVDDIKETSKIGYEAKAILLCYNEVGMKGDSSNIYWTDSSDTTVKKPVFELHVGKNKYSSYKGRLFFDFRAEMAHMTEVDLDDTKRYNQMIHG